MPKKHPTANDERPIIIKKRRREAAHAHHGGHWKVAYADFVTAMMAFFLLLWLLNVTTPEQRSGIAAFFSPSWVSASTIGSGGILGGRTLTRGELPQNSGGVVLAVPVPANSDPSDDDGDRERQTGDGDGPSEHNAQNRHAGTAPHQGVAPHQAAAPDAPRAEPHPRDGGAAARPVGRTPTGTEIERALREREEARFAQAEQEVRQAIQTVPDLAQLAQNLMIDRTPEGLRIQIVDQDRTAMFALGSAQPLDHTRRLLQMVAQVVQRLPNRISVTGHTDATPFARPNYSNWELSTDRANASRRMLIEAGLPASRISHVVGRAEQELLLADAPADPRNRRISIVLLRDPTPTGN